MQQVGRLDHHHALRLPGSIERPDHRVRILPNAERRTRSGQQQVVTDVAVGNDTFVGHERADRRTLVLGNTAVDDRLRAISVRDHAAVEVRACERISQCPEVRVETPPGVFGEERLDAEMEEASLRVAAGPLRKDLSRQRLPVWLIRLEGLADKEVVGVGAATRSNREVSASRGGTPAGGARHEGTQRRLLEQVAEVRDVGALEVRPRHARERDDEHSVDGRAGGCACGQGSRSQYRADRDDHARRPSQARARAMASQRPGADLLSVLHDCP